MTVANIPAKVFIVIYVLTNWSVKTNLSIISVISVISNISNTLVISDKSMILFLHSVSIFDILF